MDIRIKVSTLGVFVVLCLMQFNAHSKVEPDYSFKLLKDIDKGSSGSDVDLADHSVAQTDNKLFFLADDDIHGKELWSTDGTSSKTNLTRDIQTSIGGDLFLLELAACKQFALFKAADGIPYIEPNEENGPSKHSLWVSDGTRTGTRPLLFISLDNSNLDGSPILCTENSKAFFWIVSSSSDSDIKYSLWMTNGTESGTSKITTVDTPPAGHLIFDNGYLFTLYKENSNKNELWRADENGTVTKLISNFDGFIKNQIPRQFANQDAKESCFFYSNNEGLWATDGSRDDNQRIFFKEFHDYYPIAVVNNTYFFEHRVSASPIDHKEIWAVSCATRQAKRIYSTNFDDIYKYNASLDFFNNFDTRNFYFLINHSNSNGQMFQEVWKTNGRSKTRVFSSRTYNNEDKTIRAPYDIDGFQIYNNHLVLDAESSSGNYYLAHDQYNQKTTQISPFSFDRYSNLTSHKINNHLLATFEDDTYGLELWKIGINNIRTTPEAASSVSVILNLLLLNDNEKDELIIPMKTKNQE